MPCYPRCLSEAELHDPPKKLSRLLHWRMQLRQQLATERTVQDAAWYYGLTAVYCHAQEITLQEALCGTSFTITHLDKRVLKVTSAPGEVIKPDSWKCINDEGMPEHGRPFEHGNLYIQFHVKFPDVLSSGQVHALQQVLGGPPATANGTMEVDNMEQART